ncbi:hypothetical protein [Pectobacterium odoriferum]|uniref:hypothetical protein n=1 Tax=Pectobacterium odoriferum TaxID=78398 RepID=UPI0005025416|nr:hypothetical protein [Pectobacterium odoriferum]KGA37275.1 hypothetical protein KS43_07350 [Pectobacterium odoriferum]
MWHHKKSIGGNIFFYVRDCHANHTHGCFIHRFPPPSFTSVEQIGQGALDDDALSHLGFAQYYAWQLRQLGAFNLLPDSKVTKEQLA